MRDERCIASKLRFIKRYQDAVYNEVGGISSIVTQETLAADMANVIARVCDSHLKPHVKCMRFDDDGRFIGCPLDNLL